MSSPKNEKPKGKAGEDQTPQARNLSDRVVTIQGDAAPPKPQAWPPTFEEYSRAVDPRTSLF
ncbi:MAG: hypothetical protein K2X27_09485 [Candidatus Obscuribacterales bacterium]|nr:hypothetical protein [Candidatus Obscuribacterales bacterium]